MVCQLCHKNKKLIKAHLLPEWAYRYLYEDIDDEKRDSLILVGINQHHKRRPIGAYDKEILCAECDRLLGKTDEYGKQIFMNRNMVRYPDSQHAYLIDDVDLYKIKYFLASVLWRFDLSDREEGQRVNLGPWGERIREFLLAEYGDPKYSPADCFSVTVTKFETDPRVAESIVNKNIQIPHTQKIDGINVGVIYLPKGLKVFLKLDRRKYPENLQKLVDHQSNNLIVCSLGSYLDSQEFSAVLETTNRLDDNKS